MARISHKPEPQIENRISVGETPKEQRIAQLNASIHEAKEVFRKAGNELKWQVAFCFAVCCVILWCAYHLGVKLYHTKYEDKWTWQIIYLTAIRVVIATALFSFGAYCFKMLSSFILMYQHNKHKRAILDSMAAFVESGIDTAQRDIIYKNLIEIIVTFNEAGIISSEHKLKTNIDYLTKLAEMFSKSQK